MRSSLLPLRCVGSGGRSTGLLDQAVNSHIGAFSGRIAGCFEDPSTSPSRTFELAPTGHATSHVAGFTNSKRGEKIDKASSKPAKNRPKWAPFRLTRRKNSPTSVRSGSVGGGRHAWSESIHRRRHLVSSAGNLHDWVSKGALTRTIPCPNLPGNRFLCVHCIHGW